jgi:hypothetical protein
MKTLEDYRALGIYNENQLQVINRAINEGYDLTQLTKLNEQGSPTFNEWDMNVILYLLVRGLNADEITKVKPDGNKAFEYMEMSDLRVIIGMTGTASVLASLDEDSNPRFKHKDIVRIWNAFLNGKLTYGYDPDLSEAEVDKLYKDWGRFRPTTPSTCQFESAETTQSNDTSTTSLFNDTTTEPQPKWTQEHLAYINAGKVDGIDLTQLPIYADGTPVYSAAQTSEILQAYKADIYTAEFFNRDQNGKPMYTAKEMRVLRIGKEREKILGHSKPVYTYGEVLALIMAYKKSLQKLSKA